jgi:hypothetical protein
MPLATGVMRPRSGGLLELDPIPPAFALPASIESLDAITLYGVAALTFMMVMYGLEKRGRVFIAGFALGCVASSLYGFLSGAWPFGVVEAIWALVAVRRYAAE